MFVMGFPSAPAAVPFLVWRSDCSGEWLQLVLVLVLGKLTTLTNTGIEDLRQYLVLTRDRDRIVIVKFHLASKFGDKSYSLSLWDLHRHHVDTPSLEQSSVFPSGYSLVRVMGAINSLVMYRIIATMITC